MPIANDVTLGSAVRIYYPDLVNIYGCSIGDETTIGPFVEIQSGVAIGQRCKIQSHSFICTGVDIEDEVFIGHGVLFVNDIYPRSTNEFGRPKRPQDWEVQPVHVKRGASLGSNATILGGIVIGIDAFVGAGAVVTHDVPDFAVVAGVPARIIRIAH